MNDGAGQVLPEADAAWEGVLAAVRSALPSGDSDGAVELRMRLCHRLSGAAEAMKLSAMGELLDRSERSNADLEHDVIDGWALSEALGVPPTS